MFDDTLRNYIFLGVAACVAFLSFSIIGPFNIHIDGDMYVAQIEQFEAGQLLSVPYDVALRAFKPFTGVWGSLWAPLLTPLQSMQLLNLLFLFAIPFAAFGFLNELGFSKKEATWGALWIVTGYPMLKYGLAISTDIGGWFFALVSAYMVLKGVRMQSYRVILLASLLGFIGGTIKETGVFGLLFGGLYILFTYANRPFQQTCILLAILALPAFALEVALIGVLIHTGLPTFLDWYGVVADSKYSIPDYPFIKFVGVFASAFNMLIVYACVGLSAACLKKITLTSHPYAMVSATFLASLPILLWKIFISRVLYIQFVFFVPVALLGARAITAMLPVRVRRVGEIAVYVVPIVCSVSLFLIAREQSLFTVLF